MSKFIETQTKKRPLLKYEISLVYTVLSDKTKTKKSPGREKTTEHKQIIEAFTKVEEGKKSKYVMLTEAEYPIEQVEGSKPATVKLKQIVLRFIPKQILEACIDLPNISRALRSNNPLA